MEKKICNICNKEKPLTQYHRKGAGRFQNNCKTCRNALVRDKRSNNEDYRLSRITYNKRYYAKSYGITLEEYDEIISRGCEVCGSFDKPCVDHDHATGKVRGCLCNSCNLSLGRLNDDPDRILKLYEYIRIR